ncbi:ATP synthase F0F1 subunit epsilon [Mycobacterium tuberculosis]|nr:ATP synthase F0F1 subunit epsilon [Mycobacterium tuberculosis]CMM31866.1 ATP synthase F0F1 subunit epsilon [Mycobacterium tuberculosis]
MAELNVEIVAVDRNIWSGTAKFLFTRTPSVRSASCPATFRWWPNWSMTPWCGSSGREKRT